MRFHIVLALALTACSKPNPNLCCVSEADCSTNNIPLGTTCQDGLVCRGNQCIAETCTTAADCEAAAPYCAASNLCGPTCDQDNQCPGFGQDVALKFCANGGCIECRTSMDCGGARPFCDAGACRGCVLDSECVSGACGDNGACVDPSSIVYVDAAQGLDAGSCTRPAPCKTLQFGIQNTLPTRSHVVMAAGTYVELVFIDGTTTVSPTITIHGGGAILKQPPGGDLSNIAVTNVATTIQNLTFADNGGFGASIQSTTAPCTVRSVEIQRTGGIQVGSNMIVRDVTISNPSFPGLTLGGASHLLLDSVIIKGGPVGIQTSTAGAVVSISNLLVYDTVGKAADLTGATGTIEFSTIADSGGGAAGTFICPAGISVHSSIVWTPSSTPIVGGCTINTTIAGPTSVTGAINQDPLFVDEIHRDYHLASGSPAIDQVDTGPMTDVEGTPRPQGARFDLGAFEKKP